VAKTIAPGMTISSQGQEWPIGEPRRTRANPQPMDGRRACSRGGLLFRALLLAKQEEGTRAHGMRAEKDKDVGFG
jgi:hypothetical protein